MAREAEQQDKLQAKVLPAVIVPVILGGIPDVLAQSVVPAAVSVLMGLAGCG